MFQQIDITDLGPCKAESFTLNPGETTITRPSEGGKSTLMTALCFCLWGTDEAGKPLSAEHITDGAKIAGVELTTGKGNTFFRTMKRDRKQTRRVLKAGEKHGEEFKTEKAWIKDGLPVQLSRELKAGKRKVSAGRLVAVPFAWEALAEASGGRELRDVLDDVVGGGEDFRQVVSSLMTEAGETLATGDTLDPKQAENRRRDMNANLERSIGREEAAEEAVTDIVAETAKAAPSQKDMALARAVVAAGQAWAGFRIKEQAANEANRADPVGDWERKFNAIGDKPGFSSPDLRAAEDAVGQAEGRVQGYRQARSKFVGQLEGLAEAPRSPDANAAERLDWYRSHADKCPECKRKWAKAADVVADLEQQLSDEPAEESAAVRDIRAEIERLDEEVSQARQNVTRKQNARGVQRDKRRAAEQWQSRREALGECPTHTKSDAPTPPESNEPTPEAVESARETLRASERSAGAVEALEGRKKRANGTHASAVEEVATMRARVAHAAALVDAVRRAPTERLRRTLGTLGDTGPVSFRLGDDGFGVLIDGRSHKLASRGRRIFADLCFRLALRRALRMTWFPVFVDDVQCWSGEWPDTTEPGRDGDRRATPVIYLRTAGGAE